MSNTLQTDTAAINDKSIGMHRDDRFLQGIFRRFLPPTMLAVMGGTINTLVDSAIVGNMLGEDALAAINLCGPISLLCCAAGGLIGSGGSFLAASYIGQNDETGSQRCYTLSVLLEALLGLLIAGIGFLFLHPIIRLLGANDQVYQMTLDYARILLLSAPFKCLIYIPFNFLRLDGKPSAVSLSLLSMTLINGILDVVLIYAGFGMAGASAASAIGSAIGVGIGFIYQRQGNFKFCSIRDDKLKQNAQKLFVLGTPAALNNLLSMVRMILLNRLLINLGGSAWVAAFTAASSISDFALCILNGVPQTASPLIGIYCAEKNNIILRRLVQMQLLYGECFIVIFAGLTALFPTQLCGVFGLAASIQANQAMRMLALSLPIAMLCTILFFFYNATEHVRLSNMITFCRTFLCAVPVAFALAYSKISIWLFFPVAELLTLLLLIFVWYALRRRNKHCTLVLLLDETLEREGKVIDFSVENSQEAIASASERIGTFCDTNELTPKQSMAISLSIEEMLIILFEHCFKPEESATADIRVFSIQNEIGLRIRNAGKQFNPIAYYETQQDDIMGETLGIRMILKIAQSVKYQRTFGVNTLTIWINR